MILASDFGLFIGRFHPLIVHFPIGILLLALFLKWRQSKSPSEQLGRAISYSFFLGALSAVVAAFLGWKLAGGGGYNDDAIFWHRWTGVGVAVVAVVLWWFHRPDKHLDKRINLGLSVAMAVLLTVAGHLGGNITHGEGYLLAYAPDFLKGSDAAEENEGRELPMRPDSVFAFQHLIEPILDENCYSCHNETKTKGKLIMTDTESLLAGGSHGPIIVSGKSWESEMMRRLTLPNNSEKRMPPEGDPLSFQEIKLIEWWINSGADINASITSMEISDEIKNLFMTQYGLDTKPRPFVELIKVEPIDEKIVAELEQNGFRVSTLAETNNLLSVSAKSGAEIKTENIESLVKANKHITWLNLAKLELTDAMLASIGKLSNLSRLRLEQNPISDEGLKALGGLKNLESLNLYATQVSDAGLESLKGLNNLKNLYLWQSQVTKEGADKFKESHPGLDINMGVELAEAQAPTTD